MNKYQNFLVQAGRQCWPGDERSTVHKVARRPTDVKSDEWIYNLLKGGDTANTVAADESFRDVTFGTDLERTPSTTNGFYIAADNEIYTDKLAMSYQNGMHFTSKCYQCCNTGNDCNATWKPETELDWAQNWLSTDSTPTHNQV